jgi:hypothetical protein
LRKHFKFICVRNRRLNKLRWSVNHLSGKFKRLEKSRPSV